MLDEILTEIDALDEAGPGAQNDTGERAGDIMERCLEVPGAIQTFVERYSSSENYATVNNLAFLLGSVAESGPTPETANLIWELLEKAKTWDRSRFLNNALMTIDTQVVNGMAWYPPEARPAVVPRFLLHCLSQEPDDENDNADSAIRVLWVTHNWSEDRGGLRSVFNAEERQAFRDKFEEVGLEPKPILEALGED